MESTTAIMESSLPITDTTDTGAVVEEHMDMDCTTTTKMTTHPIVTPLTPATPASSRSSVGTVRKFRRSYGFSKGEYTIPKTNEEMDILGTMVNGEGQEKMTTATTTTTTTPLPSEDEPTQLFDTEDNTSITTNNNKNNSNTNALTDSNNSNNKTTEELLGDISDLKANLTFCDHQHDDDDDGDKQVRTSMEDSLFQALDLNEMSDTSLARDLTQLSSDDDDDQEVEKKVESGEDEESFASDGEDTVAMDYEEDKEDNEEKESELPVKMGGRTKRDFSKRTLAIDDDDEVSKAESESTSRFTTPDETNEKEDQQSLNEDVIVDSQGLVSDFTQPPTVSNDTPTEAITTTNKKEMVGTASASVVDSQGLVNDFTQPSDALLSTKTPTVDSQGLISDLTQPSNSMNENNGEESSSTLIMNDYDNNEEEEHEQQSVQESTSPSEQDIKSTVKQLYESEIDKDGVTVKDIIKQTEAKLDITLDKATKKMVKSFLHLLATKEDNDNKAEKDEKVAKDPVKDESINRTRQSRQPTETKLRSTIQSLFKTIDKDTISQKSFLSLVEEELKVILNPDNRKMARICMEECVIASQSGEDETSDHPSEDEAENDENENASDYDEDEDVKLSSRRTRRRIRKKPTVHSKQSRDDTDDDDDEEEGITTRSKTKSTPTKPRRMPAHMKIHLEMTRKREQQQQQVRAEELRASEDKKLSKEDKKRAKAIAEKFETNSEEMRLKRIEDRLGLLDRLEKKREALLRIEDEQVPEIKKEPSSIKIGGKMSSTIKADVMIELEDGGSSSDEDDLEIVEAAPLSPRSKAWQVRTPGVKAPSSKHSPQSVLDFLDSNFTGSARKKPTKPSPTRYRALLMKNLRAKKFEQGNKWLARELGFNSAEDHIRYCQESEMKKRKQLQLEEEKRRLFTEERKAQLKSLLKGESLEDFDEDEVEEKINKNQNEQEKERTVVNFDQDEDEEQQDEDEDELALARAITEEQQDPTKNKPDHEESTSNKDQEEDETALRTTDDDKEDSINSLTTNDHDETNNESKAEADNTNTDESDKTSMAKKVTFADDEQSTMAISIESQSVQNNPNTEGSKADESDSGLVADDAPITNADEPDDDDTEHTDTDERETKAQKPRNAAWQAILKKEAERLKKQKSNRSKDGFVEVEAEESEDEEGVTGLEDFGFSVKSEKDKEDDEDENADADDEDFKDIVDEISDDEGDEDAGKEARKKMAEREEKLRHKELMRRMREGFDGKRGGIATGGTRGNHRFDRLVAPDNRDAARRLGLLNDDELDSEDEGSHQKKGDNQIEDETALLDTMLKDRHLNRIPMPEEKFSDSEESDNEEDMNEDGDKNSGDEEDREQEKLAKRFAKRARMNRLLEQHEEDEEFTQFSQSARLEVKEELKSIKDVSCKKRLRELSTSSSLAWSRGESLGESSNSNSHVFKRQRSDITVNSQGSLLSNGSSSLSAMLNQSRRKRKSTFLGGSQANKQLRRSKSEIGTISMGPVVFQQQPSKKESQDGFLNRSQSLGDRSSSNAFSKRSNSSMKINKRNTKTSSLWSKISADGFRRR